MFPSDDLQFDVGRQNDNNFLGGDNIRGPGNFQGANKSGKKNGLKGGDFSFKGNDLNLKSSASNQIVAIHREGYYLEKLEPLYPGEKSDWSRVTPRKLQLNDAKLIEMTKKVKKEQKGLSTAEAFENLSKDKRDVVNQLIIERQAEEWNPNAQWTLSCVKKHIEKNRRTRVPETKRILVIIICEPRITSRNVLVAGPRGTGLYRDEAKIIDATNPGKQRLGTNGVNLGGLGGGLLGRNNIGSGGFGIDNDVGEGFNNGMPRAGGKIKNRNSLPGLEGIGLGLDEFVGEGLPNGMGKAGKGNGKKKKQPPQDQFAGTGDPFMNEIPPQVVGPFPDPFAGVSSDDNRFPPGPSNGHINQQPPHHEPFAQHHPPQQGQPFQQQGPPPRVDEWPPQQQPMKQQPMNLQQPPLRDQHFPHEGNPFQPLPQFNQPGGFDLPPTFIDNDPRFAQERRPQSQHRRRSLSARRSFDDPAIMRKIQDWNINDTHSSDDSFRDDVWSSPRDRDSRRSFTPPSSPGRSDYLDHPNGTLHRSRSNKQPYNKRDSRDREYNGGSYRTNERSREYDLIEPSRGRRRHSPDIYRERPKRLLQRASTDYPSNEPRGRYEDVEYEYAGRDRRNGGGGGKYHSSQRRRRETEWDFEDRRGGGRRSSGY